MFGPWNGVRSLVSLGLEMFIRMFSKSKNISSCYPNCSIIPPTAYQRIPNYFPHAIQSKGLLASSVQQTYFKYKTAVHPANLIYTIECHAIPVKHSLSIDITRKPLDFRMFFYTSPPLPPHQKIVIYLYFSLCLLATFPFCRALRCANYAFSSLLFPHCTLHQTKVDNDI